MVLASSGQTKKFDKINDFVVFLEENRQVRIAHILKNDVEVVEFANEVMRFKADDRVTQDFMMTLGNLLEQSTGKKWVLDIVPGEVIYSIANIENAKREADQKNVADNPLVKAILQEFKGAKIDTLVRKVLAENADNESDINEFDNEDFS